MWLLLACAEHASIRHPPKAKPEPDSSSPTPPTGALGLPEHVALPFATAGEPIASVRFDAEPGSAEVLSGEFAVERDDEGFVVSWVGGIELPRIATGLARITVGDRSQDITLAAVLGDPDLPAMDLRSDAWGTQATAAFPSAPFPDGASAWDDASVLVFVPDVFSDPGAVDVVTHLHGFNAELTRTIPAEHLVELHAISGRDAIFIAPQGPEDAASGDFGKLEEEGGHERLVRDVISVLYRDGLLEKPAYGQQVLTSHSGGYAAAASLLDHGGLPISAVFLYDSVYGYISTFEEHAASGGVLFSNYTAYGGTDANNLALASGLEARGVSVSRDARMDHLLGGPAAIVFTESPHDNVMFEGLTHARWLAASPLRRSPLAPPELLSVISDGTSATVTWRADRLPGAAITVVQGSDDGQSWEDLGSSDAGSLVVPARARIRLAGSGDRAGDSYAASGGQWLVVDGFHRIFGGSWSEPTHDFAARLGAALGGASTALDDAVSEGLVDLGQWDHVLWMLGDESSADETFDPSAREAIERYLDGGGQLIVTGSELGYATDTAFLGTLGITYASDDAGTTTAGGWTFGEVYEEDFPDVLSGDETIWSYTTGGAAAVGRSDRRVLAVGFGLETMADSELQPALAELAAWLSGG